MFKKKECFQHQIFKEPLLQNILKNIPWFPLMPAAHRWLRVGRLGCHAGPGSGARPPGAQVLCELSKCPVAKGGGALQLCCVSPSSPPDCQGGEHCWPGLPGSGGQER